MVLKKKHLKRKAQFHSSETFWAKMIDYKIVKFCRLCRKRFVVHKIDAKKNYCDDCQPKIGKQWGGKK